MTKLAWDQTGERVFETGVDHGVLYIRDEDGDYTEGHAWNGLTTVTESPSGAESNPQFADNLKYLNLLSAEEFGATIEAFTYPDAFGQCDGSASPEVGVYVGQQGRRSFGFSYRTRIGNDVDGDDFGYKLHLVYGALASPSEKAYATVNDSPEATAFSWEVTTSPVEVTGTNPDTGKPYRPTAQLTLDSTKVDAAALADLEDQIYGTIGADPWLPLPADVIALFAGTVTEVNTLGANSPTYNSGTHVITLPTVTGVTWKIDGVTKSPGAQPALTVGQIKIVTAHPVSGYVLSDESDDDWSFSY